MTHVQAHRDPWAISCLVPDLPRVEEITPYLREIDSNRWYTNFGPLQGRFEAALCRFVAGAAAERLHVVTVSSATSALELTLQALDLRDDARVLLPALTFPATMLAVIRGGYTPVLADVDAATWSLTPALALAAGEETVVDAVVPVAPFGYPLPAGEWADFQKTTQIPVLLDAAGALGSQQVADEVPVIFSLHATKPLGVGEGGALVTADDTLAGDMRRLSNFGFQDGEIRQFGSNAKMSEYHAAVGLAQLPRAEGIRQRRRDILASYQSLLPRRLFHPNDDNAPPAVLPLYVAEQAAAVAAALTGHRIETRRWYYPPLHRHKLFDHVDSWGPVNGRDLNVTVHLADSLVGIPFHTHLTERDIAAVAGAVRSALPDGT